MIKCRDTYMYIVYNTGEYMHGLFVQVLATCVCDKMSCDTCMYIVYNTGEYMHGLFVQV